MWGRRKRTSFRRKLANMVSGFPHGKADAKLLDSLLDEIDETSGGRDLFGITLKTARNEKYSYLKRVVVKLFPKEQEKRMAERLSYYGYEDFFAKDLYNSVRSMERVFEQIEDDIRFFDKALSGNPESYLKAILDKSFDESPDKMSAIMGESMIGREDYFEVKSLFVESMLEHLAPTYKRLIEDMRTKREANTLLFGEVMDFRKVKDSFYFKLKNGDTLRNIMEKNRFMEKTVDESVEPNPGRT